jgi:hypothetical protein
VREFVVQLVGKPWCNKNCWDGCCVRIFGQTTTARWVMGKSMVHPLLAHA